MVFRAIIPASFCQITLLLLVFKVRSFLEHNPDYCTVDIYTRRLKYHSRVKENMSNMGNCGAGKSNKDDADQGSAGKSNKDDADQAGNSNKDDVDQGGTGKSNKEDADQANNSNKDDTDEGSAGKSNKDNADQRGAELRETIKDFGYEFVKDEYGEDHTVLRHIDTGLPFEFDVCNGDRYMNQQRYEALGEVITEYVYKYLEEKLKLKRVAIPVNARKGDPKGFFFMTEDALESEKLMILIHGSGVVRAGQWARSLIINASFESGTMVPYIEQAKQEGYGVLITNGNHNYDVSYRRIKGSENPQDHFVYVWNHFLKDDKCKAKHIVIVAHSFGGVVTHHALRNVKEAVDRIKAVAFTDSVHRVNYGESSKIKALFKNKARNWASSSEPLDTPLSYYEGDCEVVSAGTTEHVWTSHCAKDSVFKYFKAKLEEEEQKEKEKQKENEQNEKEKNKEKEEKKKEKEKQKEKGKQTNPDKPETQSKAEQEDRAPGSVTEVSSVQEKQEDKKDIIAETNKEEQKEQAMSEVTISEDTNEGPNELKEGLKNDTDEKSAEEELGAKTNDDVEEDNKAVTRKTEQDDVEMENIPAATGNEESKNQFDGPTHFDGQQGVGNKVVIEQEKEEDEDNLVPEKTKVSEKQQTQKEEKDAHELKATEEEPKPKSDKEDVLKSPAQGEETSQSDKINEEQAATEEFLNHVSLGGQQKEKEITCGQGEIIEHTPMAEDDLKAASGGEEQTKRHHGLDEKNNKDETISEDELNARFRNEEQKKEETGQDKKIDDDDPMTGDDLKTLDSIPSSDAVQDRDENATETLEGSDVEMKNEEKKDDDDVQ